MRALTIRPRAVQALALGLATLATPLSAHALSPWRSAHELPFSNGRAAASVDGATGKLIRLLDHPYLAASSTERTKNLRYDAYAGVRVGAQAAWLNAVSPLFVGYDEGRGIVRVERENTGLRMVERHFAPMAFNGRAVVSTVTVTRISGTGSVVGAALVNDHLGGNAGGTGSETVVRTSHGLVESGPSGARIVHQAFGAGTSMAAASGSMANPYSAFAQGNSLGNSLPSGAVDDAVIGFEFPLGDLAVGASATFGWASFVVDDGVSSQAGDDAFAAFVNGRSAERLVADEAAAWDAWLTAPPAAWSSSEKQTYRLQQAMLRMAQVKERGRGFGQIMASLDLGLGEGNWNVAWVRDMAYATVALAETGHLVEAKDALAFVLNADSGKYVRDGQGRAYVGSPYQVSVCRYYGSGVEETDDDGTGPNIEFDGFGLYLWSLGRYLAKGGDEAFAREAFSTLRDKVVAPLVALQEPSGLVAADSSIWERHWNGNQKHFAYTSITGARGLCDAAGIADKLGEGALASTWRAAGISMQNALVSKLRDDRGFLAQSTEALADGRGYVDAAVLEALNFQLIDPAKRTYRATVNGLERALLTASGMGIYRNDDGSGYDKAEWIFLDLRLAQAQRTLGNGARADALEGWVRGQGDENFGLLAELHDERTGAYRGSVPMAGFGAGAWLLERTARQMPASPACGVYAVGDESIDADAGEAPPVTDGGAATDAGSPVDGDASMPGAESHAHDADAGACACNSAGRRRDVGTGAAWFAGLGALGAFARRRGSKEKAR